MSGADKPALPGTPGPTLQAVYDALTVEEAAALWRHLDAGTSSEWLAIVLTEHGHRISASSIKTYRRSLNVTTTG